YYAVITSFKSGDAIFKVDYWPVTFSLANYFSVMTQGPFGRNVLNSIFVSGMVVMLSLGLAVTAAYALSRIAFRGRTLLLMTVLSVSMFPQIAVLAGLFEAVRALGLYNSLWSLVLAYMIFTLPFTTWVLTTFMRDLPAEIEEAAIVDGASPFTIVTRIFLPLMWPAMASTGLLAFIAAWNEFLFAVTFITDPALRPLTTGVFTFVGRTETQWNYLMAASAISILPVFIGFLLVQRRLVSGLAAGAVK
ncbi:carbohydrate ABC transporter permease, partial [Rhizobiaceae sp. 2RAB30]